MNVFIDPACDISYASFYIQGLIELFGKKKVKFSALPFENHKYSIGFFCFVIRNGADIRNVVIDFGDSSKIDEDALRWCDVYGKINLEISNTIPDKVFAIGPSFGIKIFSLSATIYHSIKNFLKAYRRIPSARKFLSSYKGQYLRQALSSYDNASTTTNYIFFVSSLWKKEPDTNRYRANFMKSSLSNSIVTFEGGFAPRAKNDIQGFESLTMSDRIDTIEYLKKTKASSIVFNTPAVWKCHGWKLGEFLCMGKAIISTPLLRALPHPLNDNQDLVFSDGSISDLSKKIDYIIANPDFRNSLERNAKQYYDEFLSPTKSIQLLLEKIR